MVYKLKTKNCKLSKGSLILTIILFIAVITIMGYFGISLQRDIVDNPSVQSNFSYVSSEIKWLWNTYLKQAATNLWHWVVINVTNLPIGTGNEIQVPQVGN